MNSSIRRIIFWLTLMVALLATAIYYSLYVTYKAEADSHRKVILVRGQTLLDAVKAGVLTQCRMGRQRDDRMEIILEELARSPDVLGLALLCPQGETFTAGVRHDDIPNVTTRAPLWDRNSLTMASRVDFDSTCKCPEAKRACSIAENATCTACFAKGAYTILAMLDVADVHRAIRRDRLQLALSASVASLTMALGVWAVLLTLKRTELGLELARERENARQQEQVARLGAGLAHETKNPLGIVRGLAQSIAEGTNRAGDIKNRATDIVDEVDRVIGGINSFLELSRPPEAKPERLLLDAFFARFLPLVQMDAAAAEVAVSYTPCQLSVMADETLLRRALLNLILNALRASKPGQSIRVSAERSGSALALTVSDEGCGIAPEDLPRVTEPYYTRFPGGSGLGLPIVERIASAHGWKLSIESILSHGTRASLEGLSIVEPS